LRPLQSRCIDGSACLAQFLIRLILVLLACWPKVLQRDCFRKFYPMVKGRKVPEWVRCRADNSRRDFEIMPAQPLDQSQSLAKTRPPMSLGICRSGIANTMSIHYYSPRIGITIFGENSNPLTREQNEGQANASHLTAWQAQKLRTSRYNHVCLQQRKLLN
jgi:hypothetical protein